jgi:hypothetical protein
MLRRTSSTSQKVIALLSPSKDRMNLDMKRALDLLKLRSIDALEQRFLSSSAFLEPWVSFRDSFLLLQKGGMPRTTPPGQIDGPALLYYYTLYAEGSMRYDNRVDELSSMYEEDLEIEEYGLIDKSTWGVAEYEKLLYVWLLQAWKVGKKSNTGGFAYFVYKNQVTAWREVFVPIVNAVRDSYDIKGRRHYGRLAKFLEEIAPSRLAFPENNVGVAVGPGFAVPPTTPYRLVSRPLVKEESEFFRSSVIKKKQYDDTEKELRDVYPQYGQLVERPKNMNVVKSFLESQRQKKEVEKARRALEGTPEKSVPLARRISTSTLFRRSSTLKNKAHKNDRNRGPRSPVHGVERQLSLPQTPTKMVARSPIAYDDGERAYVRRTMSTEPSNTVWPNQSISQDRDYGFIGNARKASDDVYNSIHNSSSNEETPDRPQADDIPSFGSESEADYPLTPIPQLRMASTSTTDSTSNYPLSAIPRALFSQGIKEQSTPTVRAKGTGSPSPATVYDSRQSSRSKESKRAVKTSSIRPPSSLIAYLGQESEIPEETSYVQSPSDETSGRIHPAFRESAHIDNSSMSLPNAYQKSIHPALRNTPRATKPTVTRIPSPAAAYDGREYGALYDEHPHLNTASKNRVHTPIAQFNEPHHIKQEGTIFAGRPKVTRIPTALYQYLDRQDTVNEKLFQLGTPPKTLQHVAKSRSHADLSPSYEPPPPLPLKSPRRINSVHSSHGTASYSRQHHMTSKSSHNLVVPAVSIDNIRAALGSPDRSSSEDEEKPLQESRATSGSGSLTRLGGGHTGGQLRTYNSHMFPRHRAEESSPEQVQGAGAGTDPKYETGGAYEMELMKGGDTEGQEGGVSME